MDVDTKIISMYENIGYLGMYGTDVCITILLFIITLGIVSFASYKAIINDLKSNWNTNKCNPIVMPFAGLIMPVQGQTTSETTFENFNYCIQKDMSAIFSIIMMPFEFVLYLTISFLDTVLMLIMDLIEFLAWLKNILGGLFAEFYNKIINFVIPIIEITVHIRDMLGKINGIITASLFMVMNIYNITVSGVINILTILVDLLLVLIASLVLMMAAAALFFTNPFTIIPGIALEVIIVACLVGVVLPAITVTAIMHSSIEELFNESSPNAPDPPHNKSKNKKK
jgi:hypothetical protein